MRAPQHETSKRLSRQGLEQEVLGGRRLTSLEILLVILTPRIPGQSNNTGLMGRWSFDEGFGVTAGDSSGRGNNGTLTNSPAWVTPGARGSGALSFHGIDDYVELGTAADL